MSMTSAIFREQVLAFDCQANPLLGVVSLPAQPKSVGVLIVTGGPQYRVGSHRQFVLLARQLAAAGYTAMRFDYRGIGDSTSDTCPVFTDLEADIHAAIQAFKLNQPHLEKIVLWGLCDGATAATLFANGAYGSLIAGLVLANPWLESEQSESRARVRYYYGARFISWAFWKKCLTGNLALMKSIKEAWHHWREARSASGGLMALPGYQQRMQEGLAELNQEILVLLSKRDHTAQAFVEYLALVKSPFFSRKNVCRVDFENADHTFSSSAWRAEVENVTIEWLNARF